MSCLSRLIAGMSITRGHRCHRCMGLLMGGHGAHYCPNCLWDELEDPMVIRGVRFLRPMRKEFENAA